MQRRGAFLLAVAGLLFTPVAFLVLPHTRPSVAGTPDLLTGVTLAAFMLLPWAIVFVAALRGRVRLAILSGILMLALEVLALVIALTHPAGTLAALLYLLKPVAQTLVALPAGAVISFLSGRVRRVAKPSRTSTQ